MHRRRVALSFLAVLLAAGAATACGGDDDAGASGDGDDGGLAGSTDDSSGGDVPDDVVAMDGTEVAVESLDNTFRVQNIEVKAGTTVTWTNDGRNEHDVLPVEGDAWGAEVEEFQPGATFEHTFAEPGVYNYYCSIHGTTTAGMIGAVVVTE
jgi:plastocyanin